MPFLLQIAIKNAFEGMNVTVIVGWAIAVAIFSLGLILLSQETYDNVYHLVGVKAPVPISNPAIISVPISFITLVVVTLLTQKRNHKKEPTESIQ